MFSNPLVRKYGEKGRLSGSDSNEEVKIANNYIWFELLARIDRYREIYWGDGRMVGVQRASGRGNYHLALLS